VADQPPLAADAVLRRVVDLWARELPDVPLNLVSEPAPYPSLETGEADAVVVEAAALEVHLPEGVTGLVLPRGPWTHEEPPPALLFRVDDRRMRLVRRGTLVPVTFAGAGPGGIDNLTADVTRALARADVVLHDALCGEDVLRAVPEGAELIPVGKRCGQAYARQGEINEILLKHALRGRRVVRLKTGDPTLFGRLGEEIEALEDADLSYRVLSGLNAASTAAAWLGRPLTERGVSTEIVYSTGRFAGGDSNRWPLGDGPTPSLALFMSRRVIAERMDGLREAGTPADTPVAIVEKIGSEDVRAVHGTVATIAALAEEKNVGTPAIVLVGGSFRPPSHLPLHGLRIWLPGEREIAEQQREHLEEFGAVCILRPLIEPEGLPFDADAVFARPFDWIVFTSPKGVDYLLDAMRQRGLDARWLPDHVAALGGHAVTKLRSLGIEPDLIPPRPFRRAMIESLLAQDISGKRILLPCSAVAPDEVREALAPVAGEVVRADLYGLKYPVVAEVPGADMVLFTSPSTVESARQNGLIPQIMERGLTVGGIGPVTAGVLEKEGLPASIVPTGYGPENLTRAVVYHRVSALARA
jgi:uroporphyrinogen III methyltransferase / synthase